MDFDTLNETIPYATGGKEKILRYSPYPNVTIAMPGRHQNDTEIPGADFVVMVTDPAFKKDHQFTHDDIFNDVESRTHSSNDADRDIMVAYKDVITGTDPSTYEELMTSGNRWLAALNRMTFIHAVQCLAVAEHRRYARFESKWGGRYLPFRFSAGISEGLWSAQSAIDKQRMGRPGVEMLEKEFGVPQLTKELMK